METIVEKIPRVRISKFAGEHGLTMRVVERKPSDLHRSFDFASSRFYAHFDNCEVKEGSCLVGIFGNGATEKQAIANYAKEISNKRLVINAFRGERREIEAPYLY